MWRSLVVLCSAVGCFSWSIGCQQSVSTSNTPQPADVADTAEPAQLPGVAPLSGTPQELAAGTESNEALQASAEPAAPDWRTEVVLSLKSWAETKDVIAAQRGKIVVVDVWSTACLPCLREFPHLVELQQTAGDDIVCIGLNCDFAGIRNKPPEVYRDRVLKVLHEKEAHIINIMCNEPADELFPKLKIDSIPATFVYDRTGRLVKTFDNNTNASAEFTYAEDVIPFVRELMDTANPAAEETAGS